MYISCKQTLNGQKMNTLYIVICLISKTVNNNIESNLTVPIGINTKSKQHNSSIKNKALNNFFTYIFQLNRP